MRLGETDLCDKATTLSTREQRYNGGITRARSSHDAAMCVKDYPRCRAIYPLYTKLNRHNSLAAHRRPIRERVKVDSSACERCTLFFFSQRFATPSVDSERFLFRKYRDATFDDMFSFLSLSFLFLTSKLIDVPKGTHFPF